MSEDMTKQALRVEKRRQQLREEREANAKDGLTETTTRVDEDGFKRTALVIGAKKGDGSIDVVDKHGRRLCQINISHGTAEGEEYAIVDVIDVDDRFSGRAALHFTHGKRHRADLGPKANLVSVDFRRKA